jgi:hypothetical protein
MQCSKFESGRRNHESSKRVHDGEAVALVPDLRYPTDSVTCAWEILPGDHGLAPTAYRDRRQFGTLIAVRRNPQAITLRAARINTSPSARSNAPEIRPRRAPGFRMLRDMPALHEESANRRKQWRKPPPRPSPRRALRPVPGIRALTAPACAGQPRAFCRVRTGWARSGAQSGRIRAAPSAEPASMWPLPNGVATSMRRHTAAAPHTLQARIGTRRIPTPAVGNISQ